MASGSSLWQVWGHIPNSESIPNHLHVAVPNSSPFAGNYIIGIDFLISPTGGYGPTVQLGAMASVASEGGQFPAEWSLQYFLTGSIKSQATGELAVAKTTVPEYYMPTPEDGFYKRFTIGTNDEYPYGYQQPPFDHDPITAPLHGDRRIHVHLYLSLGGSYSKTLRTASLAGTAKIMEMTQNETYVGAPGLASFWRRDDNQPPDRGVAVEYGSISFQLELESISDI